MKGEMKSPESLPRLRDLLVDYHRRVKLRTELVVEHAAQVGELEFSEGASIPWIGRIWKYLVGAILFFLGATCLVALANQLVPIIQGWQFWLTVPVWFSLIGFLCWNVLWYGKIWRKGLVYVYVMGHELAHVIAIWLSMGRVHDMRVTSNGGYVMANKDSVFIALAPYLVPFWAIAWILVYQLIGLFCQIESEPKIFYMGLGAMWGFHFTMTWWAIREDQPDLKNKGTFFSLSIVYFCNLIVFVFGLSFASWFSLEDFFSVWGQIITGFFSAITRFFL